MDTEKIQNLAKPILEAFQRELTPPKLKKVIFRGSLTTKELEAFEEAYLNGIQELALQWLHRFFPSLSLVEKCDCGSVDCPGFKLKGKGEDKCHEGKKSQSGRKQ